MCPPYLYAYMHVCVYVCVCVCALANAVSRTLISKGICAFIRIVLLFLLFYTKGFLYQDIVALAAVGRTHLDRFRFQGCVSV